VVYSLLLVSIVLAVLALAVLGAAVVIGLVIYRARTNAKTNQPEPEKELDEEQAAEVVSTWNILHH
jgi:hypothetical protein